MNTSSVPHVSTTTGEHRRARSVVTELAVVGVIYLAYRAGRLLTRESAAQALDNARHVVDFEMALGIFSERAVQGWVLGSNTAIEVLNRYYVSVHFPITVAFLMWAYLRHNSAYRVVRTWFALVTLTALAIHVGFPLAPPRMMPGFVDTLQTYGPRIYPSDPRRSVANQYAAMPSLHFGWSVMLAAGVIAMKRNRRSLIVLIHPAITLIAIVATANHFWLDAIIVTLLVALFGTILLARQLIRTGDPMPATDTMDDGHFEPALAVAPPLATASGAARSPAADLRLDAEGDDDDRFGSQRRRDRCRQRTVSGDRLESDGAASPTHQAEGPPPP